MVRFSPELETLGAVQRPEMKFTASGHESPQAAQFRVAVDENGAVRYCFLRKFLRRRRPRRTGAKISRALLASPPIENRRSEDPKTLHLGHRDHRVGKRHRRPPSRRDRKRRAVIRVSLSALVTIYLLVFLAAVFLLWIVGEWNRRRRERRALRYRLRCVICAFEFEDRTPALLPRCPRCGSLNERFKPEQI